MNEMKNAPRGLISERGQFVYSFVIFFFHRYQVFPGHSVLAWSPWLVTVAFELNVR